MLRALVCLRMSQQGETVTLTPEQIENWRTALIPMLGPYALLMPEDQVQRMRDKMQEWINEESQGAPRWRRLKEELGEEPWSLSKIALAFAKVSGNMESVIEMEQSYKGPSRTAPSTDSPSPYAERVRQLVEDWEATLGVSITDRMHELLIKRIAAFASTVADEAIKEIANCEKCDLCEDHLP